MKTLILFLLFVSTLSYKEGDEEYNVDDELVDIVLKNGNVQLLIERIKPIAKTLSPDEWEFVYDCLIKKYLYELVWVGDGEFSEFSKVKANHIQTVVEHIWEHNFTDWWEENIQNFRYELWKTQPSKILKQPLLKYLRNKQIQTGIQMNYIMKNEKRTVRVFTLFYVYMYVYR